MANFHAHWGFQLDPLSAVMLLIVTGVGLLIHVYSTGYMAHEGGYYRFFGYLNLFMFSMLMLVLANNLLLLFVGWEGVGTVQLPADRLLLSAQIGVGRGEESVHRQPHRRRGLPARHFPDVRAARHDPVHRDWPGARWRAIFAWATRA